MILGVGPWVGLGNSFILLDGIINISHDRDIYELSQVVDPRNIDIWH
jgi:hypothetical protein